MTQNEEIADSIIFSSGTDTTSSTLDFGIIHGQFIDIHLKVMI